MVRTHGFVSKIQISISNLALKQLPWPGLGAESQPPARTETPLGVQSGDWYRAVSIDMAMKGRRTVVRSSPFEAISYSWWVRWRCCLSSYYHTRDERPACENIMFERLLE